LGKHARNCFGYVAGMTKINFVALGVSDLMRSVRFYQEVVGFDLQGQMEQFAFFNAGGITLMLNAGLRRPNDAMVGAMELVLGAEGVTTHYEELKRRGCNFVNEPHQVTGDSWAATFSDPDGHWLTLFGPK
jgi:predicted enzyme related to lactoylglutathione lyase